VHRAAVRLRGGDEPARGYRQAAIPERHREHAIAHGRRPPPEQRRPVERRDLRTGSAAREGRLVERQERLPILRRHDAALDRVLLEEHAPHGLLRRRLLDLHQNAQLGKGPEHLAQSRNPRVATAIRMGAALVRREVPAGVNRAKLGEGQGRHRTGPVCGAVECRVVEHHRGAVGGEADVELDRIGTPRHGRFERG
jgi:hypothetical protein